jgi:hypothetical protein
MHLLDYRVDPAEQQTARPSRKLVVAYQGKGAAFSFFGEQRRFLEEDRRRLSHTNIVGIEGALFGGSNASAMIASI